MWSVAVKIPDTFAWAVACLPAWPAMAPSISIKGTCPRTAARRKLTFGTGVSIWALAWRGEGGGTGGGRIGRWRGNPPSPLPPPPLPHHLISPSHHLS